MARARIGTPRAAVSSYKDDIKGFWDDMEKPTTPWTADLDPVFSFQGVNIRDALSALNRRFYEYLMILKDQTTATSLRNFVNQCLDNIPQPGAGVAGPGPGVLLPSTGPGNHGIMYIPGLSLGVIFQHFLAEMDDYMSTQQSLDNLRARPGVPGAASFFMLLKKDSMFKEKHWTANPFEVIGATYVSSFRSTYCEFDEFIGTLCYYYMRQTAATGPQNVWMGTDGPAGNVAMPIVATANLAHLGGAGTPAQQLAAMQAMLSDLMFGAAAADDSVVGICIEHYTKFVHLLEKHAGLNPIFLSADDGGTIIPLTRYQVVDTEYCCASWFPSDVVSKEAAELGCAFAEMNMIIPYVDLLVLNTSVVQRISGTNDVRFNNGANADNNSVRIAIRHPSFNISKHAWKRYAFQHEPFPLGIGQPRNATDYSRRIKRKIEQAREELADKRSKMEQEKLNTKEKPEGGRGTDDDT